ncbi:Zn finger family DNA binding protein [Lentinula aciculospora]|uniref:Zn finger family DNA binding protein n=1 Tax=Lentinula aciculospora TaxID=153920 RepID=A0A9W9DGL6_9AGAR|nr:Zn finger family DNA binding protein [Lentinula aciculospora]
MFSSSEPVASSLYPVHCEPAVCKPFAHRSGSDSFYEDIAQLVSSSVSPANSPDTVDDDLSSSPGLSPTHASPNYYYVSSLEPSFGSPSSPTEMYDTDPPSAYPATSNLYQQPLHTPQNTYSFTAVSDIRESAAPASYPSDSPSPADVQSSADFSHSYTESHSQISSYQTDADLRYNPASLSRDSYLDTSPPSDASSSGYLDHRRMSEPALVAIPNAYSTSSSVTGTSSRYSYPMSYSNSSRSSYPPSLQRGASIGSLRDLRLHHQHLHYSSPRSHNGWKIEEDSHHMAQSTHASQGLDSPLSPFQPNFTGGTVGGSPSMAQSLQYSSIAEDHCSASPTGTSTPASLGNSRLPAQASISSGNMPGEDADVEGNRSPMDPNSKTYSFVALPGNTVKKRPRRRYDEIERLYQCSWPDCNKAYGTLNHLNAHVTMQKHGSKRSPNEFKELRKQWRKAKKESEAAALGGVSRRTSHFLSQEHDLNNPHSSRYPPSHHRYGYSTGMALPGLSMHSRYNMGADDVAFNAAERDERSGIPFGARPRYDTTPVSQWNPNVSSTRSSISTTPYLSSSLPSQSSMQHYHPGHGHSHSLHQVHFGASSSYHSSPTEPSDRPLTIPSPPQMHSGRLPPDSMLLTPLPGYEPRETLPPLQVGNNMTYDPEAYYEGESGRRSGSGHASMSRGSGDDY